MIIGKKALTFIEVMAIIIIISILYSVSLPMYNRAIIKAKEAALLKNLQIIRRSIDLFYRDNLRYPNTLEELVKKRYIRSIPKDPITGENNWKVIPSENNKNDVYDIKSLSTKKALNGEYYSEW